jgi:hypothetical protein
MTQRYANVHEVATMLGVTESAIRGRVARGTMAFIRDPTAPHRLLFDLNDIARLVAEGRRDPAGKKRGHGTKQ